MVSFVHITILTLLIAFLGLEVLSQTDIPESTTTAPIQLIAFANYSQPCKEIRLPFTFCNTYQGTVACKEGTCQCNMPSADVEFHEEWNLCVGKVGSLCFTEANLLGRKVCVEGADCFPDKGTYDHYVGTCKCLHGYKENAEAKCEIDEMVDEGERSTVRPTSTVATRAPTTTRPPTTPGTGGGNGDGDNGSGMMSASGLFLTSILCILSKIAML